MTALRVAMIAGEASGDVLAAGIIKQLKLIYPNAVFEGIGGQHMQAQGFHSYFEMESLSVMGLVEVLKHLPTLLKIRSSIVQRFIDNPPDVFVGIDAPDFNLPVEKKLKKRGIRTVHYVSPTVWAWRESRIHKVAAATNLVLGIFPFEQPIYDKYHVPYQYVGHTMADGIAIKPDFLTHRQQFGIADQHAVLAILPGSRAKEVSNLLPAFIDTANILSKQIPGFKVLIPAANMSRKIQIESILSDSQTQFEYQVTSESARDAMLASDAVLLASGTASLEAMLCKKPMVVAYRMSALTYKIMQRLYKPKYFALPNILAGEQLVPELLQEDVNPGNMAKQLLIYFQLPYRQTQHAKLITRFEALHLVLSQQADQQSARAIAKLVEDGTFCEVRDLTQ